MLSTFEVRITSYFGVSPSFMFAAPHSLVFAFLLVASAALGQGLEAAFQPTEDAVGVVDPLHTLTFPESSRISSVAFTRNGESALVVIHPEAINLWSVIVYLWPEILGGLALIVTARSVFRIVRITRDRRIVGVPYCRKCGYCLKDLTRSECPECGVDTLSRSPILGRSTRLRLLPSCTLMAVVLAGYGTLWATQVPRKCPAAAWLNWWSVDLAAWARNSGKQWWINHISLTNQIVEMDVASGKRIRVLATRSGYALLPLAVSPDGNTLFLEGPRGGLITLDTSSGRTLDALSYPGRVRHLGGFSHDGKALYLVGLLMERRKTQLIRWAFSRNTWEVLLEIDAEVHEERNQRDMVMAQRFFRVPGGAPRRVVQLPNGYGVEGNPVEILVRDLDADLAVTRSISTSIWPWTEPLFTRDGNMYFLGWGSLKRLNLESGETKVISSRETPYPSRVATDQPALDPVRQRLIVPADSHLGLAPLVEFFDCDSDQWTAQFALPLHLLDRKMVVSPDGGTLAVVGFKRAGKYIYYLLLYDLSELEGMTE